MMPIGAAFTKKIETADFADGADLFTTKIMKVTKKSLKNNPCSSVPSVVETVFVFLICVNPC